MISKVVDVLIKIAIASFVTYLIFAILGKLILMGIEFILIPVGIFFGEDVASAILNSEWTWMVLYALVFFPVLIEVLDLKDSKGWKFFSQRKVQKAS